MNTYDLTELRREKLSNVGVFGLCFHACASHTSIRVITVPHICCNILSLQVSVITVSPAGPARKHVVMMSQVFKSLFTADFFIKIKPPSQIHSRKSQTFTWITVLDVNSFTSLL